LYDLSDQSTEERDGGKEVAGEVGGCDCNADLPREKCIISCHVFFRGGAERESKPQERTSNHSHAKNSKGRKKGRER